MSTTPKCLGDQPILNYPPQPSMDMNRVQCRNGRIVAPLVAFGEPLADSTQWGDVCSCPVCNGSDDIPLAGQSSFGDGVFVDYSRVCLVGEGMMCSVSKDGNYMDLMYIGFSPHLAYYDEVTGNAYLNGYGPRAEDHA